MPQRTSMEAGRASLLPHSQSRVQATVVTQPHPRLLCQGPPLYTPASAGQSNPYSITIYKGLPKAQDQKGDSPRSSRLSGTGLRVFPVNSAVRHTRLPDPAPSATCLTLSDHPNNPACRERHPSPSDKSRGRPELSMAASVCNSCTQQAKAGELPPV